MIHVNIYTCTRICSNKHVFQQTCVSTNIHFLSAALMQTWEELLLAKASFSHSWPVVRLCFGFENVNTHGSDMHAL